MVDKWIKNNIWKLDDELISRCCMSRYCKHSLRGYCIADDETQEKCPYLQAIGEIARLSAEVDKNTNKKSKNDVKVQKRLDEIRNGTEFSDKMFGLRNIHDGEQENE